MYPVTHRRFSVALIALVLCAGCSPGEPRAARPRASSTTPADLEVREAVTSYYECLRDRGVDVTAPEFDANGDTSIWPKYEAGPSTEDAERKCGRTLKRVAFEPTGSQAAFIERAQGFVDCMRRNGVRNIEVTEDGIHLGPGTPQHTIRGAEKACRSLMEGL